MGIIQKFQNAIQGSRAVDIVNRAGDVLGNLRNTIQGWAGAIKTSVANGSAFVGLNYDQVPAIRQAVRDYVKRIQDAASGLNDAAQAENAVKGEVVAATQQYLKALKEVLDAYITGLLVYSDKMEEYYQAYKASDTTLSSDVSQEATSLSNSAADLTYTEQM